jgi:hypothetical protein
MLARKAVAVFLVVCVGTRGAAPVKLIIDTDMGGGACMDVDDVAALCVAHALTDNGEAELLAVVQNSQPPACTGVISVLNHWYGRDAIPLGAYKGAGLPHSNQPLSYVDDLVGSFTPPVSNSSQVPDAVKVYRRVLAAAPSRSVAISSIGLLTNLELLLRSGPDEHSQLSGRELVADRVTVVAAMAGVYPSSDPSGKGNRRLAHGRSSSGPECNMCGCYHGADATSARTAEAASKFVFSSLPPSVRVVFSGDEVGRLIRTGAALEACAPVDNPCRRAFMDYQRDNPDGWAAGGRCSWDPLTTLVAVRGASASASGVRECEQCDGENVVTSGGNNHWAPGPPSNQSYLVLEDARKAAAVLDHLLCQPPARPGIVM